MSAVGVVATLTVAEGKNAEFEATFADLPQAVRDNEPGNEFYAVFKCKDNPQQYSKQFDWNERMVLAILTLLET